jgi:hypothetical protein
VAEGLVVLGRAEVGNPDPVRGVDEAVVALEVAVYDDVLVEEVHPRQQLARVAEQQRRRQPAPVLGPAADGRYA